VISERIERLHIFFCRVFADADEESIAPLLQHLAHASTQFRCERIRNVTNNQPNRFCSLPFQAARQTVAPVVHLADHSQNTLACLYANVAGAVNHARNRHRCHCRQSSNVGQRYLSFGLFFHAHEN